jgi:iron-sulfur cluster assembly protein
MLETHSPSKSIELTITEPALAFMKRIVRFSGAASSAGFRLTVSPGGCSGLSSSFDVRDQPIGGDLELRFGELRLFVPAGCAPLLDQVTIDFTDTKTESGLTFVDPKAEGCACSSGVKGVQLGLV